jgi:integrase/recombinase XerD
METYIADFLIYIRTIKGFSENTVQAYSNDLEQLCGYIEPNRGKAIDWQSTTTRNLSDYLVFLREQGNQGKPYANATLARKIAAIKSYFTYLYEENVVVEDATQGLSSPKVGRSLPSPLSIAQVDVLLQQPLKKAAKESKRDKAMLELLYASGMRVTELVSLNIEDVRLEESLVRCLGKGTKERLIPLYPEAARATEDYVANHRLKLVKRNGEKALFLNLRGERLTRQGFWLILKGYARQAEIGTTITPHTLRHSFATHMLRGGAALRHVQELLGHSSISTTQVYTQLADDHLRTEYERAHPRSNYLR